MKNSIIVAQYISQFSKQFYKNKLQLTVVPLLLTLTTNEITKAINELWLIFFFLLSLVLIVATFLFFLNQRFHKRNHLVLIAVLKDNNEVIASRIVTEIANNHYLLPSKATKKVKTTKEREVPIKIATQIKQKLEKFEKKQGFLDPDLKLTKLAEQFETNTKYLAKVILEEKGKSHKDYIKALKIVYAKARIDNEYKFRRYKMKVIANECGFKTAESFSKCFLETYKIYPSKHIKKLEEERRLKIKKHLSK